MNRGRVERIVSSGYPVINVLDVVVVVGIFIVVVAVINFIFSFYVILFGPFLFSEKL